MPKKITSTKLYYIEKILDYRTIADQTYYLIKWQGYPMKEATWEQSQKVPDCAHYLKEYQKNVKKGGHLFYFDPSDQPMTLEQFMGLNTHTKQVKLQEPININLEQPSEDNNTIQLNEQIMEVRSDLRKILNVQNEMLTYIKNPPKEEFNELPICKKIKLKLSHSKEIQTDPILIETIPSPSPPPQDLYGNFEIGDQIERIGQAVQIKKTKVIMYYVLWKKRTSGITPKNTWVESDYLKKYDPRSMCLYLKGKVV